MNFCISKKSFFSSFLISFHRFSNQEIIFCCTALWQKVAKMGHKNTQLAIVCTGNFARPGGGNHNINGHKGQICQKVVKMDHKKTHTANAQETLPGPAEAFTISVGCSEYVLYKAPLTKVVASKISLIISNKQIQLFSKRVHLTTPKLDQIFGS